MASTPEGRRLTEQHRLAQQQVRDGFLAEFIALWALLDSARLDETGPGWVNAVTRLVRAFRLRSAEVATRYYWEFRSAEAPTSSARPRIVVPERRIEVPETPPPPAGPSTGRPPRRQAAPRPRRADGSRNRRPRGEDVIPEPRSSRIRWDFDESVLERRDERRTRIEIPDIDWEPRDRAVEVSLIVTGPVGQKSKRGRGKSEQVARDESFVESSGAAARHVLTGGRQSLLTLLEDDPQVVGWARVTDGDPCAFCAMLSSRGIVYLSEESASFRAHDHCACTAEPAYSRTAPLPGRGSEFQQLWNEHIRNRYSGAEARRAWRRLYEQLQRDQRRPGVA